MNETIGTKSPVRDLRSAVRKRPMSLADDYRRHAEECLALAQHTADPNDKARLLQMAQAWHELATKRDAKK